MSREDFLALIREDFQAFVEWAFWVLHPNTTFLPNWHIQAIAHALVQCAGGSTKNLLINVPPRYLKSHCSSVCFVAWMMGRSPALKFMCVSYGETLARELAEACRKVMLHEEFQAAFPALKFADSSPTSHLKTTLGGHRLATSVGAASTGIGCDFMIIDDLTKAGASANERLAAIEYYQSTLVSRLDSKESGIKIVVGQRTARDDLPGFLIDQGGWVHLNLSVKAWKPDTIALTDRVVHHRATGDLLHAARESQDTLDRVRNEIGSNNFDAQYLGRPGAPDGAIINPNWFPRYVSARPLAKYESRVLVVDAATSDSSTADFTVCSVFGVRANAVDLLDVWRKRVLFDDLEAGIRKLIRDYKATHLFIESEVAGKALAQVLGREYKQGIHGCHPGRCSKHERVELAMPYLQQKIIRIPTAAPWLSTWEGEVFGFPSVVHDDQVDTLAYFALNPGKDLRRYSPLSTESRSRVYFLGGPRRYASYADQ